MQRMVKMELRFRVKSPQQHSNSETTGLYTPTFYKLKLKIRYGYINTRLLTKLGNPKSILSSPYMLSTM